MSKKMCQYVGDKNGGCKAPAGYSDPVCGVCTARGVAVEKTADEQDYAEVHQHCWHIDDVMAYLPGEPGYDEMIRQAWDEIQEYLGGNGHRIEFYSWLLWTGLKSFRPQKPKAVANAYIRYIEEKAGVE